MAAEIKKEYKDLREFKHQKGLYSLLYPEAWTITEGPLGTVFSEPSEGASTQPVNINIAILPSEHSDLNDAAAKIFSEMESMGVKLDEQQDMTISGIPAKMLKYSMNVGFVVCFVQAFAITPIGNLVTFTLTGLEDDVKKYSKLAKKMLSSLKIVDQDVDIPIDALVLKPIRSKNFGFVFKLPETWQVASLTKDLPKTFVSAPDASNHVVAVTHITHTIQEKRKKIDLEGYIVIENESSTTLEDYKARFDRERRKELAVRNISDNPYSVDKIVTFGGQKAHYLAYADPITQKKTWTVFTLYNSRVYIVTFTSTASFDDNREVPVIVRVLENFEFNNDASSRNLRVYESLMHSFSIAYDPDVISPQEHVGAVLSLAYQPKKAAFFDASAQIFINVFVMKVTPGQTLDEYCEQTNETLRKELGQNATSFDVHSVPTTLSGEPALQVIVNSSIHGIGFMIIRVIAIKDGMAYTVTIEGRQLDLTEENLSEIQHCTNSFKFFSTTSQFV